MHISSLFLLVFVVFLGIFYIQKKYRFWKNRGVPYVKPTFPRGNFSTLGKTEHFAEILKKFYFDLRDRGKVLGGIYFMTQPIGLILDLDFVKTVLVKDFQYCPDRPFYINEKDDPLTCQLFSVRGEQWRNLRSKLSPTFTSGKMKLMFPIVRDISDEFIKCLKRDLANKKELELGEYLSRFTIDIIGSCAFGIDCNSLRDPDTEFFAIGEKASKMALERTFKHLFMASFARLSVFLGLKSFSKDVTDFYTRIVRETMSYREKMNIKKNDFMSMLMQLQNTGSLEDDPTSNTEHLSFNQAVANSFLFLVAGYHTSATAMEFCLLELANHIKIQNHVREEITSVLKSNGNELTYEALAEMKYLGQVINETLRKHPPAAQIIRSITKNYNVPSMNLVLEKGTRLFIPVLGIHHDPEIYPDPQKFDPERFSPEAVKSRHPYAFLAFGEGPRNCIGARFAMMQMKVGLTCLLMNYQFTPSDKANYPIEYKKSSPLLSPIGDCWLKVEKIN
ncbi:probable cytochrome P450 6a13 [Lutzomyia longipalpis]|uniref:probable cytochrome P450 6a13 n=1 Tax=Lutzomyia longipalpis TaxID=7200 RepID=UPI002483DAE3|nr:probable cytochrome P450 6a13 [Lutzomyia longipalpis]